MNRIIYHYLRLIFNVRVWLFEQFTLVGVGVLVALALAGIVGLGSTQSMTHLLFFFALALIVVAWVGRRSIRYQIKVRRALPRFGTLRMPLQYQVELQNLTAERQAGLQFVETCFYRYPSFKAFVRIKRRHRKKRKWGREWRKYVARQQWAIAHPQDLPILSARSKTEITGEVLPIRRGRLCFEATTIVCADPLGLMNRRMIYPQPQSVCILPKRYQLPPLNLASLRTHQMGEALLTSAVGEALEFRSLRDYRPGDPTNKIHWKSWAKVGRPITKEQQDESAVHYALILDTFSPEPESAAFENAIAIAVSYLLHEEPEESLLDVIFYDHKPRCVTVGRDLQHREPVLETLATMAPCQDQAFDSLNPLFQVRFPRLSGCFCILLDFDETRQAFLKMLLQSTVPTKVIVLGQSTMPSADALNAFQGPQCHVHFIAQKQIQQDLLRI